MKARFIAIFLSFFIVNLYAADTSSPQPKQQIPIANKINLNKVDAKTLTGSFKGIGKKRAQAIIAYRENHHGFKSIEELGEVKGIGQHFVEVNREKLHQVFAITN